MTTPLTPTLHMHLLGDFRLVYDQAPATGLPETGVPVTGIKTARLRALLAYLVLHRDAPQSRSHLAFTFWLDSTEAQARSNLRKQVYYLRRELPEADRFLYTDAKTLQWRPEAPLRLDVSDFEEAVAHAEEAGRDGDQAALRALLERAVDLYGGDLLPACYEDWVLEERERLRQRFAGVLEQLIRLLESKREYQAAIVHAQRLLRHDALREATYRRLIRLHALNGDRARALRAYHTCATVLSRELDVEPGAATREAYERLLELDEARAPLPVSEKLVSAVPLIGREGEWAQLQAAWRATSGGRAHLVLLSGEAGIGKTRLAEELLDWAERQGIPTARTRCYASEGGLAYSSVASWLRTEVLQASLSTLDEVWLSEVARLLPELLVERPEISAPGPLAESWRRQRLFEALARAFLQRGQLVLFMDDVQWCDGHTLEWLPHLLHIHASATARGERRAQLLLIGTMRVGEAPDDGRLASLLRDLRRSEQLAEIELGPLNEEETLSLAARALGRELDPALATPLYRGSEGNPLFVVEMVRAGQAKGGQWIAEHAKEKARVHLPLPPKVRRVIETRLAQLSPPAQDLVSVAATIGREFTVDVVLQASGSEAHASDEETLVYALDELWQRRIVREQGADAYDFSHDRIREVAYAGLSAVRRRFLHRRVAEALVAVHKGDLDPVSGRVAAHYEQAGQPEQAIPAYQRAAQAARRMYANEEAVRHVRRAIELLPRAGGDGIQAAQLHERLADILALMGNHEEARQAYQTAILQVPEGENLWRARLKCQLGNTWRSQHHHEKARTAYDEALRQLGPEPATDEPAWWQAWLDIQLARADLLYFQSRLPELAALCREMEEVVAAYGTAGQQAACYSTLVMLENRLSRFRPSKETVERVVKTLELARESGDQHLIDHRTFGLGFTLLWYGDLGAAEGHLSTALTRAERTGNIPLQDRCLAYLQILFRLKGDPDRTRAYAEQGLAAAIVEQNPTYIGVARASFAWLNYRAGDLDQAVRDGREAMDQWRGLAYPLHWLALWPLLAIALGQGQVAEAIDAAQAMLDPVQQRLPETLETALEQAIQAWDDDYSDTAGEHLAQALDLAAEMGHM